MPSIIAIDGPAGAGKSTVARRVANALNFTYLDTGAMYRSVAWQAQESGVDPQNEEALVRLAQSLQITFSPLTPDGQQHVAVNGRDATEAIRTPEVSQLTSVISAVPAVRRVIVAQQQALGARAPEGVVLEGRDIGTVVFPHADLKIFLTAGPEERARRRAAELQTRGLAVDYKQILQEQIERDRRDSRRADSPLVAAPDAVPIATDGLSIDAVVAEILALFRAHRAEEEAYER